MRKASKSPDDLPKERYAVTHDGQNEKVATFEIVGQGCDLKFHFQASDEHVLEHLRQALQPATPYEVPSNTQSDAPRKRRARRATVIRRAIKSIEKHGFRLARLPASDLRMTMEVHTPSGRKVAVASALHQFAELTGVEQRIFDTISNVGSSFREKFVKDATEALEASDSRAAAAAFVEWCRTGALFGTEAADLALVRRMPVADLTPALREEVLFLRLDVAGQLNDFGTETEADLRALLAEFGSTLDSAKRAALAGFQGIIAIRKGHTASAIRHWKDALKGDDATRGGAHRSLSRTYPTSDPEAARHAELAADALLQAGDREGAATCLQRLARCLLPRDPNRAVQNIEKALALFDSSGPLDRDRRASLLHYKAIALEKLGSIDAALVAATQAATERRDLMGAEQERVGNLVLASQLASRVGNAKMAAEFQSAAEALGATIRKPGAQLRQAAGALALNYDANVAARLRKEAEASGDKTTVALLTVLRSTHEGTPEQRLEWLENALASLRHNDGAAGDIEVVLLALGMELTQQGEVDLALRNYQELLTLDPFNQEARQNTAALLMGHGRWQEAIAFFQGQREMFGDKPGILYSLGKAQLEAGDVNAAATTLMLSKAAAGADKRIKDAADKLAEEAILRGGQPDLVRRTAVPPEAVTHSEFETELRDFARFFQAEQRMRLWQPKGKAEHRWVPSPEGQAQDSVNTFLNGRFKKRIQVYAALAAGAGFVDLYVVGDGGFRAIIELKMVGRGYSSTYAFKGKKQIAHYMEQKNVSAGYLVLFDARVRDFAKGLGDTVAVGQHTIRVLYVDVRSDSPSKQR